MMKKSKMAAVLLAAVMALSLVLAGCSGGGNSGGSSAGSAGSSSAGTDGSATGGSANTGDTYTIRMGCATVLPSHPNYFMELFKEKLEEKSDQFTVELYPANQLGSNVEMIQGLQNGTVQTVVLPIGFFTPTAPVMNILDLPRLVPDSEVQYEMLNNSEIGDEFVELISEKGITPLSFLYCVEKEMILDKEVTQFSDLKGLKIRGFDSDVAQAEIKSYGATPVSMSTGDLAMALQQGAINGVHADVTMFAPLKLFEQAPHLVQAPFSAMSNCVMFSNIFLDSLPDDLRQLVEETVVECREETKTYTHDYVKECYAQIEAGGGSHTIPDASFYDEIDVACQGVHADFLKSNPDFQDLYDKVDQYVQENKK